MNDEISLMYKKIQSLKKDRNLLISNSCISLIEAVECHDPDMIQLKLRVKDKELVYTQARDHFRDLLCVNYELYRTFVYDDVIINTYGRNDLIYQVSWVVVDNCFLLTVNEQDGLNLYSAIDVMTYFLKE